MPRFAPSSTRRRRTSCSPATTCSRSTTSRTTTCMARTWRACAPSRRCRPRRSSTPGSRADAAMGARVLRWVAAKVAGGAFVLWAIATLIFFGLRLIPGDPAQALLGGPGSQASEEALALVRREHGLDLPLADQYLLAMGQLATGDLGTSYSLRQDMLPL